MPQCCCPWSFPYFKLPTLDSEKLVSIIQSIFISLLKIWMYKKWFQKYYCLCKKKKKSYYVLDCFQRINREGVIVGIGFSLKLDEEWMFSKAKKKKKKIGPPSQRKTFLMSRALNEYYILEKGKVKVAQLCPALGDPMDYSSPGSTVHGILQARILEWVAIPFSRGYSQPRDRIQVTCIAGGFFTDWATTEAHIGEATDNIYIKCKWRERNWSSKTGKSQIADDFLSCAKPSAAHPMCHGKTQEFVKSLLLADFGYTDQRIRWACDKHVLWIL